MGKIFLKKSFYLETFKPMIKKFAQKYGIDEDCLEEIEKKFMASF